ncbi:hypothetical protein ACMT4L_02985 [Deinococcus sp. A31D244]|uniref:hypothetical protein n=1 Tax=Deinococcus sp. A31D244 TaxID=3397675 RepID=UPI0039E14848
MTIFYFISISLCYIVYRLLLRNIINSLIILLVLHELIKKLIYIAFSQEYGAEISNIAGLPIIFFLALNLLKIKKIEKAEFKIIMPLIVILGAFFIISQSNFFEVLPSIAAFLILSQSNKVNRSTYRIISTVFIISFVSSLFNIIKPDYLWTSYSSAAIDYTTGAFYSPERGYFGGLFSSPAEYGLFIMFYFAIMLNKYRTSSFTKFILTLSCLSASLLTGSRYILFGVIIYILLVLFFKGLSKKKTGRLITIITIAFFLVVQDSFVNRIVANGAVDRGGDTVIERRINNTNTLGDRSGFISGLFSIEPANLIKGSPESSDRHNLILRLIFQGTVISLFAFMIFIYNLLSRVKYEPHHYYYIITLLLISFGGPQILGLWSMIGVGILMSFSRASIRRVN